MLWLNHKGRIKWRIRALFLAGNKIGLRGLTKLSEILKYFSNLVLLDLRDNRLEYSAEFVRIVQKFSDNNITILVGENPGI